MFILSLEGLIIPSSAEEFNFSIIPFVPPNNSMLSRRVVLLLRSV